MLCSTYQLPYRVLRCAQSAGAIVYPLGNRQSKGLKYSRHVLDFVPTDIPVDGAARPELATEINDNAARLKIDLVLAGDIPATRSLIAVRDRIQAPCFPMPDLESFDCLNDKWQFYRLCQSLGIRTPVTRLFSDVAALQTALDGSKPSRPQIVKPLNRCAGEGCVVLDAASPRAVLSRIDYRPMIMQDFIVGEDIGSSVFCRKGEVKAFVLHQHQHRVYRTYFDARVLNDVAKIARRFQLDGVFNFDMRLSADGEVHYLECNPRFFFSIARSMIAGINFVAVGLRQTSSGDPYICAPATVRSPRTVLRDLAAPWKIETESWRALFYLLSDPLPYLRERLGLQKGL
jgi:predicted ATP-grasp superfamily ATP-dependent carboligase